MQLIKKTNIFHFYYDNDIDDIMIPNDASGVATTTFKINNLRNILKDDFNLQYLD